MAFRIIRIDFQCRLEISDRLIILGWIRQDSCQIKICFDEVLVYVGGFLKVYLGLVKIAVFLAVVSKFIIGEGKVGLRSSALKKCFLAKLGSSSSLRIIARYKFASA